MAIRHDDMFALPRDVKAGLLERLDHLQVIDARKYAPWLDRNIHFAHDGAVKILFHD